MWRTTKYSIEKEKEDGGVGSLIPSIIHVKRKQEGGESERFVLEHHSTRGSSLVVYQKYH